MSMHVIGTAGHVDHGKSALVQKLTGTDPDRLEEEKRRGLTIDLGFAHLPLPSGGSAGIVDVPGHERFIKNMLSGAGGITICLFVVAANEGWKPQSIEHLSIIDLLGIRSGVVAITKSDTVEEDILQQVTTETENRLRTTTLEGVPVVACSARTGAGLDELLTALDRAVALAPPVQDIGKPRLWIDRVFTIEGAGTVVTGTLTGGSLKRGEDVVISPRHVPARVRNIQSHNSDLEAVGPGNRVALNLSGLGREDAARGDAVVRPLQWATTQSVDVRLSVQSERVAGRAHQLTEKGAHLLYTGSAETPVRVRLIGIKSIGAGETGYAQLRLRDPLPLGPGDRFVLRDAGRVLTFGGGMILDPEGSTEALKDPQRLAFLEAIDGSSSDDALIALVGYESQVPAGAAARRTGATIIPDQITSLNGLLVSPERLAALQTLVGDALTRHHRGRPLERGLPLEELRTALMLDPTSFSALIDVTPGVEQDGALLRVAGHRVSLSVEEQAARSALLEKIGAAAFSPPLAVDLGADPTLLRVLVDEGDLVRVGDFFLTRARAGEARALVRQAIEAEGPRTVAQIRDLLGTSRKYAVPLCEWLDATGATLRRGDVRVAGPDP